jgi:hypothetical protein
MRIATGQIAIEPVFRIDVTETDHILAIMKKSHVQREAHQMIRGLNDDEYKSLRRERLRLDHHLNPSKRHGMGKYSMTNELRALKETEERRMDVRNWLPENILMMTGCGFERNGRHALFRLTWWSHQALSGYWWNNEELEPEIESQDESGAAQAEGPAQVIAPVDVEGKGKGREVESAHKSLAPAATIWAKSWGAKARAANDEIPGPPIAKNNEPSASALTGPTAQAVASSSSQPSNPLSQPYNPFVIGNPTLPSIHAHPPRHYTLNPYNRSRDPTLQKSEVDAKYRGNAPKPQNGRNMAHTQWRVYYAAAKEMLTKTGYTADEVRVACERGRTRDVAIWGLIQMNVLAGDFQDTEP